MHRPWASNIKSSNMDVMSELGWWMVPTTARLLLNIVMSEGEGNERGAVAGSKGVGMCEVV